MEIRLQTEQYSASGYYAIQFFSLPSPIKAFRFEDVPHSCRKCCNVRSEKTVTLRQVVKGEKSKFFYTYDFGDSWEHEILVEKPGFLTSSKKSIYMT